MRRLPLFWTLVPLVGLIHLTAAQDKPPEAKEPASSAARKVKQVIGHRGSCSDRPENTLVSYRRAIEVGATVGETDVRTTKDGELVCRHDADLARTTNGNGLVSEKTLAEIKELDAGSWFDPQYQGERIPTLREVLQLCKGKMHVMLDLKESGQKYAEQITAEVRKHGEPKEIVLGIRSVEHARQFRKLLPEARQIGLVPKAEDIEAFAEAGVETIRLWPDWLKDQTLVPRVRKLKCQLHLHAPKGTKEEVLALLPHEPESLSSDDPGRLLQTLAEIKDQKKKDDKADEKTQLNKDLISAAALGKLETVKDLLKKGADVQWRDPASNGKTPLVKAIMSGKLEVVKFLLENGADINYPDGSGRYPVYFCCIGNNVELLQFLLAKGGDKDINRGPFPMLVSLCDHGQAPAEFIPILIKAGVSPDEYKDKVTPLIAAIQLDPKIRKPEIARAYVKALIENKADVNLKDKKEKMTPLEWAKKRGDQEIIEMLEKAGAK